MSQTFKNIFDILVLIVAMLFASTSGAFATMTEACADAMPLELDSTYRGHAGDDTEILVLEVPAPGIVAVDVTVPITAAAEPKLGFLGRRCSTAADPDAAAIDAGIAHQTIAFRAAGEYYLRVAAQDPRQSLGDHKVHARFVTAATADDTFETTLAADRGPVPVRQTDFYAESASDPAQPLLSLFTAYDPGPQGLEDEEVDPDPNGFGARRTASTRGQSLEDEEVDPDPNGFGARRSASTDGPQGLEDEEVDPDPNGFSVRRSASTRGPQGLEDEEVDPDPNSFSTGERVLDSMVVVRGQGALGVDFCRRRGADDHHDVAACATPLALATAVSGRLGNDWNDDVDVFAIQLTAPLTVQIATRGHGDTIGGLYDPSGQRLAVDDDGGDGANFRIVKSLPAGRYFVRVEGGGSSDAAYELTARALSW